MGAAQICAGWCIHTYTFSVQHEAGSLLSG